MSSTTHDICLKTPLVTIFTEPWTNDNGKMYSRAGVFMHVQRRPEWFTYNVKDIMAMIFLCCLGVITIPVSDAGNRISLLVGVLLVAVAFQYSINSALLPDISPQVFEHCLLFHRAAYCGEHCSWRIGTM